MKKVLLLCLVLLGGVLQTNAATKRIYVKTDGNWMQYCGGKTYLYVWEDGQAPLVAWPGTELTLSKGTYGTWGTGLLYADIENLPDTKVNFIIDNNNSWQTGNCTGTLDNNTTLYWYSSSGSGNTYVEVMPDAWYFVSWTSSTENNRTATELTTENGFSVDVDVPTESVYCCIAPTIALSHDKKTIDFWDETYLPKETVGNYAIWAFNTYTGEFDKTNSNCWEFQTWVGAKSKFSADLKAKTFTVTPYRTATIGPAGYITYSNGEKCVVSGAKAYTVSANNTSSVTMTEMAAETVWPESAGMILGGSNGDEVTISAVASDATTSVIGDNLLKGTGNSTATPDKENVYVFSWNGSDPSTVGFYKASGNGELAAHKAYLDLSTAGAKTADFLSFDFGGETTSINSIKNGELRVENYDYHNLAGQKVNKDYKGIVIVNGKKYLRK